MVPPPPPRRAGLVKHGVRFDLADPSEEDEDGSDIRARAKSAAFDEEFEKKQAEIQKMMEDLKGGISE